MNTQPKSPPITIADPQAAVREWFARLSQYCAAVDYPSTHAIFAPDVVSFGTKAKIVSGLEPLQANQWEGIWPNIRDFQIELDTIHSGGDANHAWGIATWTSTGFDEAGRPFHRPGRATVILERRAGTWLAIHTHFSLAPGTPPRTYGPTGDD
jgi:ketosteroid isomerase-like protein